MIGSRDNPVFATYSCYQEAQDETGVSTFATTFGYLPASAGCLLCNM